MGNLTSIDTDLLGDLEEKGYMICQGFFDGRDINELNDHIQRYARLSHPGIIKEEDGVTFRGIHGPHLFDEFFQSIAANERVVTLAETILGEPVYLHQFKINMKQNMSGQSWPWHEDFVYWKEKDGVAEPKLINIALMLDDSDMLSGPLCFIPGSHKQLNTYAKTDESMMKDWANDLSADLNYKIDRQAVAQLIEAGGVEYALGNAGDLLVFNPLIAHSSASNLSPHDRRLLILTFNTVSNAPKVPMGRPEFLCGTPS